MALSIQQVVASPVYAIARANGSGITDAVERARAANAFRRASVNTIELSAKRNRA